MPLILALIVIAGYRLVPGRYNPSVVASQDTERLIHLQDIQIALTAYQKSSNHYPASLNDLVPGYIEKLPKDPVTNASYNYQLVAEGKDYRLCATLKDKTEKCASAVTDALADDSVAYGSQLHTSKQGWSITYDASTYSRVSEFPERNIVSFSHFSDPQASSQFSCMQSYEIRTHDNPENKTIEQWRNEYYASLPRARNATRETLTLNAEPAERYTQTSEAVDAANNTVNDTSVQYYVAKNSKVYEIYYSNIGHEKYSAEECQTNETIIKKSVESFKVL